MRNGWKIGVKKARAASDSIFAIAKGKTEIYINDKYERKNSLICALPRRNI